MATNQGQRPVGLRVSGIAVAVLAAFLCLVPTPTTAAPTNVLTNGTFDADLSGWTPGAGCQFAYPRWVNPALPVFPAHNGGAVWVDACGNSDDASIGQNVNLVGGSTYTISGYIYPVRDAHTSTADFGVSVWGTFLTGITFGATGADGWIPFSVQYTANSTTEYSVRFHSEVTTDKDYLMDDLSMSAGSPPDAPSNVMVRSGNKMLHVSWAASPSSGSSAATGYRVQYATNGGDYVDANRGCGWNETGTSTATNCNLSGLQNGTSYTFRVAAVNDAGQSDWVESVAATPARPGGGPSFAAPSAGAQPSRGQSAVALGKTKARI